MMTAIQGIVAAGTVAYLTREASWERVALTANHLFYLVGIACDAASVEISYFSFAAKGVFILTPVFLIGNAAGKTSLPGEKSFGNVFNRLFYVAAAVSTLVLVAMGNTAYGVGFFSVAAFDLLSRSDKVSESVKTVFGWGANAAAVLSFASYWVKLATPQGQYLMGVIAGAVFLPKIWSVVEGLLSQSGRASPSQPIATTIWDDRFSRGWTSHALYPVGLLPAASTSSGSGSFLGSLMGKLPHGM